jgi:hypothetical protein
MVCFSFEEAVNREGAEGFVRGEEGKEGLSAGVLRRRRELCRIKTEGRLSQNGRCGFCDRC